MKDDKAKVEVAKPAPQKLLTKKEAAPPVAREKVNQFYYPGGKPITKEAKDQTEIAIQKAFGTKGEITLDDFEAVVSDVCKMPKIFKKLLFVRIKKLGKLDDAAETIPKQSFINFWKREYENESVEKRTFKLLG